MIKDLILRKHFIDFRESWQLSNKEESVVFEQFVNNIVLSQDEVNTFVGRPELLDFCSTGGGDDAKLDGIGIKINGQLIGSEEDIKQIVDSNKRIDVDFFIIQSKERTDFDSSAVNTFGVGVRNFFSEPIFPENDKVKELRRLKDYILNDDAICRKLNKNPSLKIYYVFCGQTPDDEHTEAIKKLLIKGVESCDTCFEQVSFNIIDGKMLVEKCKDLVNDFTTTLNIRDIIPLTVKDNEKIKAAYAFTCEAKELLKLLTKEDGSLRRALYNSNVRDYLGNRGGVNAEIENTIVKDPQMFLMCNNGITIVCSYFLQIKDKNVRIDNPQIVNGCQTCTTIFLQKDKPSIEDVQVLVKLIYTEDSTVTNQVVRGTNKQNQVLDESFETTKLFHQTVEDFFLAKTEGVQLYYERRNKQYSSVSTVNKYQIVNLRVLTQAFVATFLRQPYKAHRHESVLLREFASDDMTRVIYCQSHPQYPYYISALIWYRFEDAFRRNILHKSDRTYLAHMYYVFTYIAGVYPPTNFKSKDAVEKYCEKLEKVLNSVDIDTRIKEAKDIFLNCKTKWISQRNSQYVIKESKEFTDLLTRMAREILVEHNMSVEKTNAQEKAISEWHYGAILKFVNSANWFAFIKSQECPENVYFDSRSFDGPVRNIVPNRPCKFIYEARLDKGVSKLFALKVTLLD